MSPVCQIFPLDYNPVLPTSTRGVRISSLSLFSPSASINYRCVWRPWRKTRHCRYRSIQNRPLHLKQIIPRYLGRNPLDHGRGYGFRCWYGYFGTRWIPFNKMGSSKVSIASVGRVGNAGCGLFSYYRPQYILGSLSCPTKSASTVWISSWSRCPYVRRAISYHTPETWSRHTTSMKNFTESSPV